MPCGVVDYNLCFSSALDFSISRLPKKDDSEYPIDGNASSDDDYITGGDSVTRGVPRERRVPKQDLATTLQALLQSGRLKFAEELPRLDVLQKFKAKINRENGHASVEHWRERDMDDLVLSLAIACWLAEQPRYQPGVAKGVNVMF